MQKLFKQYINELQIDGTNSTFLLAVSGGLDSVCMVDLFKRSNLKFAIAHCNFGLRGSESDEDEEFSRKLAKSVGVEFFVKHIKIKDDESIQLKAREKRYEWFDFLKAKHNFNYIATAHHLDDSAETMLLNLAKGTGLSGLHGILPKRGQLLRPLMFSSREMLFEYAQNNSLTWREDSSNLTDNYTRNSIRHNVLKPLKSIVPQAIIGFKTTAKQVHKTEILLNELIGLFLIKNLVIKPGRFSIKLADLEIFSDPIQLLYHWLKPYGFGLTQLANVYFSEESGKKAISEGYELFKNRNEITLAKIKDLDNWEFVIDVNTKKIVIPEGELKIKVGAKKKENQDLNVFYAEENILSENLVCRTWRKGDKIQPHGMNGSKKISDLFSDLKFDTWQKTNTPLLCIGQTVLWVVGYRVGKAFKNSYLSKRVVKFQYLPNK